MPYVEITQRDFEDVLNLKGYKWKKLDEPMAKENIYLIEDPKGYGIKIFSSIVGGVGRGVGADAIRVVGWDSISSLPVMASESRVYRTDGWRQHLIERIENVREKMVGVEKCQICGGIKVERINRQTNDKFMGCLNYKNHPKKGDSTYKKPSGMGMGIGMVVERPVENNFKKIDDKNVDDKKIFISPNTNTGNMMTNIAMDAMAKATGKVVVSSVPIVVSNIPISTISNIVPVIKNINVGSEAIKIVDVVGNERLVDTKSYKWGRMGGKDAYGFEKFNVIQSGVCEFVESDNNVIIQAKTSTGKTIMGELFMWPVLASGKKVIYTSPLKALTREKWDAWTKKFGGAGYKIAIVTGDYRLTDKRIKELNEANIILCTSEMLDHRTRNVASEKSEWLMKAGLLIVDEVQLIGMKERGDKLEAGLMRFSQINSGCRLVFLSGTMPNSSQIAGWVKGLNGKETILVRSEWRPIKLNMIYKNYNDREGYYAAKDSLMNHIMGEVRRHEKDKILIFVHSKTDGRRVLSMLIEKGYVCEFHNADLETDDRVNIEDSFKSRAEGSVRIIIATSTLAYGLNLPARIVIIAGMHRGIEEVSELDIIQMCGRSGRMGIDTEGDAIILLPETQSAYLRKKIENPGDIISQISDPLVTGFHVIGEVVNRQISTRDDVYKWYNRTLASRQDMNISKDYVDKLVDYLIKNDAIKEVDQGDGSGKRLVETELGKACSYFYLRPDMLKDMMDNWNKIFELKIEGNDFVLTRALSRLRVFDEMIVSKAERGYIDAYVKASKAMESTFGSASEGQCKVGQAYMNMFKGIKGVEVKDGKRVNNPLVSLQRGLQQDIERIFQAMMYLDAKYTKWGRGTYWNGMAIRIKYGVGPELVDLCRLEGVGGTYAKRLYDSGIRTPVELVTKRKEAIMALGARYEGVVSKNKEMFEMMGLKIDNIDVPVVKNVEIKPSMTITEIKEIRPSMHVTETKDIKPVVKKVETKSGLSLISSEEMK